MLTLLTLLLFVAVFLLCFTFNSLLFQRTRWQSKSDSAAVAIAETINRQNQLAQMNELQSRCRELVFDSRQQLNRCDQEANLILRSLCDRFTTEARESCSLVNRERDKLNTCILEELGQRVKKYNADAAEQASSKLPWLETAEPMIVRVEIGSISGVESNVKVAFDSKLAQFDQQRGYVQAGSKLYKANINARLPDVDADLNFYISSLPALTFGSCSPARNANNDVFVSYGTAWETGKSRRLGTPFMPAAIRIHSAGQITAQSSEATLSVCSVGATSGAHDSN